INVYFRYAFIRPGAHVLDMKFARDLCSHRPLVHMRTVGFSDIAGWGREMKQVQEYHVAPAGELHLNGGSKKSPGITVTRRLIFAIATVVAASSWSGAGHAQAGGPFAG